MDVLPEQAVRFSPLLMKKRMIATHCIGVFLARRRAIYV